MAVTKNCKAYDCNWDLITYQDIQNMNAELWPKLPTLPACSLLFDPNMLYHRQQSKTYYKSCIATTCMSFYLHHLAPNFCEQKEFTHGQNTFSAVLQGIARAVSRWYMGLGHQASILPVHRPKTTNHKYREIKKYRELIITYMSQGWNNAISTPCWFWQFSQCCTLRCCMVFMKLNSNMQVKIDYNILLQKKKN